MSYKGKPCYYCGSPATSMEHSPPRQMFRSFACDSITVPSCDDHNGAKSGLDQAITTAFLTSLANILASPMRVALKPAVVTAIVAAQPKFHVSKKSVSSASFLHNLPKKASHLPDLANLMTETDNLPLWIRQLTAAFIYDANRMIDSSIRWSDAKAWSFNIWENTPPTVTSNHFITKALAEREEQVRLDRLTWYKGWSAHPRPYPVDIYQFQLHLNQDRDEVIFRHLFYSQYTWYVRLSVSPQTKTKLRQKVGV